MEWWSQVIEYLKNLGIYSTTIGWRDVIQIFVIAVLLYYLLKWTKTTRAWSLLKGILVIGAFLLIAFIAQLDSILWIAKTIIPYAVFAILIVLQPEIRKGLENLGRNNFIGNLISTGVHHSDTGVNIMTTDTIAEIVKACTEMGKARTGALIVIQKKEALAEYETTGIIVDAVVSRALLINIFEKNTPLHDGAVIIVGNRVTSATCYLPLSDSLEVDKALGTRHRAAIGVSEKTDSVTVVVSEETGHISITTNGRIETISDGEKLRTRLISLIMGDEDKKSKGKKDKKSRRGRRSDNNEASVTKKASGQEADTENKARNSEPVSEKSEKGAANENS